MKRLVWVLVVLFFIAGCKPKAPQGIIESEKMEQILYDIHLVDGYISTIYIQDSARKVGAAYYKGIYKKYDTDSVQYAKSLNYYNNNPDQLQEMYKAISKKLDNQKVSLKKADSLMLRNTFVKDSIKIIKKYKADSLLIRKKMKPDSASKATTEIQIKKKKAQADSLINTKRNYSGALQTVAPTAVQ
ncbi:DUF4296 domain-containing protein [Pedobacter sp. Leaf250]|uniref:DUF4296 domain-containing protein n=1 Tax=Pedobacter sp. Leaf250 TaxID=2876559 RepID=UPI001E365ED7|nr:DUF4296 domain-containing protein [Pedobacter sp. Leaf250]